MNKDISDRIKFISFVMTCFIAVYHCMFTLVGINSVDSAINSSINSMTDTLAYIAMCWFFSLSGFLLLRNLSFKSYPEKIKRRVKSLLIPYFIWQFGVFALTCVMAVLRKNLDFSSEMFKHLFYGVFLMKEWPPDGALWYLYALFFLALLSPVLLIIFKNKKIGWIFVIAVTFFVYRLNYVDNFITEHIYTYGYLKNIIVYFPAFLIGAFIGYYSDSSDGSDNIKYLISVLLMSMLFEKLYPGFVNDSIGKILPILLLYFMPVTSHMRDRKIYKITFLIYAIHKPLLFVKKYILALMLKIMPLMSMANIMLRLCFLVVTVAVATGIYICLKKVSPKLLKLITGGRI